MVIKKNIILAVILVFISSIFVNAETASLISSPENKENILGNAISTTNLVNLPTGEFQISYPLSTFSGRGGFSFTPRLSYNPSYSCITQISYKNFNSRGSQRADVACTDPFSWTGNGFSLNPFGYISYDLDKTKDDKGRIVVKSPYSFVLPDGTSAKLIKIDEIDATAEIEETEKIPGWDYTKDAKITTFKIENNPYFIVKRKRVEKKIISFGPLREISGIDEIYGEEHGKVQIFDPVEWVIKGPDNTLYFFEHPQYSIKALSGGVSQLNFFTPKFTWQQFYKHIYRWDITEVWPNGLETNAVSFAYEEIPKDSTKGFVNKGAYYYQQMINDCIQRYGKEKCHEWHVVPFPDLHFGWEAAGDSKYISASYLKRIYQKNMPFEEEIIFESDYDEIDDVLYRAEFSGNDFNDWNIHPSTKDKNKFLKIGSLFLNQGEDFKNNEPFGAYRKIKVKPFTAYAIEAKVEIPADYNNLFSKDMCTVEDLSAIQNGNMIDKTIQDGKVQWKGGPRPGYYGILKIGTRSFDDTHKFIPNIVFERNQINGGIWDHLTINMIQDNEKWCFAHQGTTQCDQHFSGTFYNLDGYLVNCWNFNREAVGLGTDGIIIDTYDTFATADETEKMLYLAFYNGAGSKIKDGPRISSLTIREIPPPDLNLKKVTHKKNGYKTAIYELSYKDVGLRYNNLWKIEQISPFMKAKRWLEDEKKAGKLSVQTLPATEFEYDDNNKKLLKKIKLPTKGSIEFDTVLREKNYKRSNYWAIKTGDLDHSESDVNKDFFYVKNVKVDDGYDTYETSYDYAIQYPNEDYWDGERETFFTTQTTVTNPLKAKTFSEFYTPWGVTDETQKKDLQKLIGTQKKTITYNDNNIKLSESENELFVNWDPEKLGHNNVFNIRTIKQTQTAYDEFGKNPKTIKTLNSEFDTAHCDLPKKTVTEGFLEDNPDKIITETEYINLNDGIKYTGINNVKCFPTEVIIKDENNKVVSKSTTDYFTDMPKIGLVKQTTAHNLDNPTKNIITKINYDEFRNKKKIIAVAEDKDLVSEIFYGPNNKYPKIATNPLKHEIEVHYNDANQIVKVDDENDYSQYFVYDELGRLCKFRTGGTLTKTTFDGTKLCEPISIELYPTEGDPRSAVTQESVLKQLPNYPSFYDIQDYNSKYEYYPEEHRTYIENLIDSDLNLHSKSWIFYDKLGRTEQTQILSPDGNAIVSNVRYNKLGLQKFTDKPFSENTFGTKTNKINNIKTEIEYDSIGRAKITKFPDNAETETTYGSNWVKVKNKVANNKYTYTKSTSDTFGRLVKVEEDSSDGNTFNNEFFYKYDTNGNLIEIKAKITDDGKYQITTNKYNSLNQLKETEHPDTGITKFTYDKLGNLETKTDARDITITYEYDELNRLTKVIYPNTKDTTRIYDNCANGKGRLCHVDDSSGTMDFYYDDKGRVKKEIKTIEALGEIRAYDISYTYDDADNVETLTLKYKDSQDIIATVKYSYNKLNQLTSISDGTTTTPVAVASYDYNPSGTIKQLSLGGSDIDYSYTDRDWLKEIKGIFNRGYEYDKIGNIKVLKQGATTLAEFDYDDLDRLTNVINKDYYRDSEDNILGDMSFVYDKVGNRRTLTLTTPTETSIKEYKYGYEYGTFSLKKGTGTESRTSASNILFDVTETGTTTKSEYNVIGSLVKSGDTNYKYNEENRLTEVNLPDGKINRFVYDMNGLRAAKQDSQGVTFYVYDMAGNNIFEETVEESQNQITGGVVMDIKARCRWWDILCWFR